MKLRIPLLAIVVAVALVSSQQSAGAQDGWLTTTAVSYLTGGGKGCSDPGCTDPGCSDKGIKACADGCGCSSCIGCGLWAEFEYLLWWGKGRYTPPLATTSTPGTARAAAGVLGLGTTGITFGNGSVGGRDAHGARVTFGTWMDDHEMLGIGGRFFGLQGDRSTFNETSAGTPIIARPFFNELTALQDAVLVAFPGVTVGNLFIDSSSDVMGAEAFIRSKLACGPGYNIDMIAGYHFTRIDDGLQIHSNSRIVEVGGVIPFDTVIDVQDLFDTRNEFHGAAFGLMGDVDWNCWSLSGLAKVSFGNMHETVIINGRTAVTAPGGGGTVVTPQGLLAMPSNIGVYERDRSTLVPEVGLKLVYHMRDCLDVSVGYSGIYWANAVLAGDQIDLSVDPTQTGGGPNFAFRETDYWVHGFTFGALLRY